MELSSPAFNNGSIIPRKYGFKYENFNPPLNIKNIPTDTKSLVLIIDDPDALDAVGKIWTHWIVWNISPDTTHIPENSFPKNSIQGKTDFEKIGYGGPAPPDKEHTYIFHLYALNKKLDNQEGSTKEDIIESMKNFIIAQTILTGRYSPDNVKKKY